MSFYNIQKNDDRSLLDKVILEDDSQKVIDDTSSDETYDEENISEIQPSLLRKASLSPSRSILYTRHSNVLTDIDDAILEIDTNTGEESEMLRRISLHEIPKTIKQEENLYKQIDICKIQQPPESILKKMQETYTLTVEELIDMWNWYSKEENKKYKYQMLQDIGENISSDTIISDNDNNTDEEYPGKNPYKDPELYSDRGGIHVEENIYKYTKHDLLTANFTSIRELPHDKIYKQLEKILYICTVQLDHSTYINDNNSNNSNVKDYKYRQAKNYILTELVNWSRSVNFFYLHNESCLRASMAMITSNIFRPMQLSTQYLTTNTVNINGEIFDDECIIPPIWTEVLAPVYDFFLCIISLNTTTTTATATATKTITDVYDNNNNKINEIPIDITKILKQYINIPFILRQIDTFNTDIQMERDFQKTMLHRIYAKFMPLRASIRKAINNYFYIFLYEKEDMNGISEMLEILGSIINGFALPLKNEHKNFFHHVQLPLYKCSRATSFFSNLSYCILEFIDKDPSLTFDAIKAIYRYWPLTNSAKCIIFLSQQQECIDIQDPNEPKSIEFYKIFSSILLYGITSPHFNVAERSATLLNSEACKQLLSQDITFQLLLYGENFRIFSEDYWGFGLRTLLQYMNDRIQENPTLLKILDEATEKYHESKALENKLRDKNLPTPRQEIDILWEQIENDTKSIIELFPPPLKRNSYDLIPPFI